MKKMTGMSLLGLLAMGMLVSCDKDENPQKPEKNYTETAFGLNMPMVYVEGGTFDMGATAEQGDNAENNEKPVRTIKLKGFHIGKYEITQAQWKAVMGTTLAEQRENARFPGWPIAGNIGEGDNYPMFYVSWDEALEFCKKLSEQTGKNYVLPTEAQWEYAARGGNKSQHYKYAGSNDLNEVAWYKENSHGLGTTDPDYGTHPVGTKKANEWGLYDMSGNVWEWCSDWFDNAYDANDTDNPQGPAEGSFHVCRGGSWFNSAVYGRVSARNGYLPTFSLYMLGFRVVCITED